MSNAHLLSRRVVLRGLGSGIALPWLEAMGPMESWVHCMIRSTVTWILQVPLTPTPGRQRSRVLRLFFEIA